MSVDEKRKKDRDRKRASRKAKKAAAEDTKLGSGVAGAARVDVAREAFIERCKVSDDTTAEVERVKRVAVVDAAAVEMAAAVEVWENSGCDIGAAADMAAAVRAWKVLYDAKNGGR